MMADLAWLVMVIRVSLDGVGVLEKAAVSLPAFGVWRPSPLGYLGCKSFLNFQKQSNLASSLCTRSPNQTLLRPPRNKAKLRAVANQSRIIGVWQTNTWSSIIPD
jgi:hypothetical protein